MTNVFPHLLIVLLVWILCGLSSGQNVGAAYAAPLRPEEYGCSPGRFPQADMAGNYQANAIMIEISPCGVSEVWWINAWGEHHASYYTEQRFPGGGLITSGFIPDPDIHAYLDGMQTLVVKPAEIGWLQIVIMTEDLHVVRIYRLKKME